MENREEIVLSLENLRDALLELPQYPDGLRLLARVRYAELLHRAGVLAVDLHHFLNALKSG